MRLSATRVLQVRPRNEYTGHIRLTTRLAADPSLARSTLALMRLSCSLALEDAMPPTSALARINSRVVQLNMPFAKLKCSGNSTNRRKDL